MSSLGIIYNWYSRLPAYDSTFRRDSFPQSELVKLFKDLGLSVNSSGDTKDLLELINNSEAEFISNFRNLYEQNIFFNTFFWMKDNMHKIRSKIRNSYVNAPENGSGILMNLKNEFPRAFKPFIRKIKNQGDFDLYSLEKKLDYLEIDVLSRKAGIINSPFKRWIYLIKDQLDKEIEFREAFRKNDDKTESVKANVFFRELYLRECKFVNSAIYSFEPDLIALQCLVGYKYFFYNLRIRTVLSKEQSAEMLVNYNLN